MMVFYQVEGNRHKPNSISCYLVPLSLQFYIHSYKNEKIFYFYEKLPKLFASMLLFNFCLLSTPSVYVYTMPLEHYLLQIVNISSHLVIFGSNTLLVMITAVILLFFCYKT